MDDLIIRQKYKQAVIEYGVFYDFSSVFPNWYKFVYVLIPNNWLKMHGYPKHKRRVKHG